MYLQRKNILNTILVLMLLFSSLFVFLPDANSEIPVPPTPEYDWVMTWNMSLDYTDGSFNHELINVTDLPMAHNSWDDTFGHYISIKNRTDEFGHYVRWDSNLSVLGASHYAPFIMGDTPAILSLQLNISSQSHNDTCFQLSFQPTAASGSGALTLRFRDNGVLKYRNTNKHAVYQTGPAITNDTWHNITIRATTHNQSYIIIDVDEVEVYRGYAVENVLNYWEWEPRKDSDHGNNYVDSDIWDVYGGLDNLRVWQPRGTYDVLSTHNITDSMNKALNWLYENAYQPGSTGTTVDDSWPFALDQPGNMCGPYKHINGAFQAAFQAVYWNLTDGWKFITMADDILRWLENYCINSTYGFYENFNLAEIDEGYTGGLVNDALYRISEVTNNKSIYNIINRSIDYYVSYFNFTSGDFEQGYGVAGDTGNDYDIIDYDTSFLRFIAKWYYLWGNDTHRSMVENYTWFISQNHQHADGWYSLRKSVMEAYDATHEGWFSYSIFGMAYWLDKAGSPMNASITNSLKKYKDIFDFRMFVWGGNPPYNVPVFGSVSNYFCHESVINKTIEEDFYIGNLANYYVLAHDNYYYADGSFKGANIESSTLTGPTIYPLYWDEIVANEAWWNFTTPAYPSPLINMELNTGRNRIINHTLVLSENHGDENDHGLRMTGLTGTFDYGKVNVTSSTPRRTRLTVQGCNVTLWASGYNPNRATVLDETTGSKVNIPAGNITFTGEPGHTYLITNGVTTSRYVNQTFITWIPLMILFAILGAILNRLGVSL